MKKYLFFIPMWIPATGNVWDGFALSYKGGSIIPCIIAHSMIDALSLFVADNEVVDWIYIGATIVVASVYCIYLSRLQSTRSVGNDAVWTDT